MASKAHSSLVTGWPALLLGTSLTSRNLVGGLKAGAALTVEMSGRRRQEAGPGCGECTAYRRPCLVADGLGLAVTRGGLWLDVAQRFVAREARRCKNCELDVRAAEVGRCDA